MASTYLSRTNSSANQQTFTISCWVKSSTDANQTNGVWSAGVSDNGFEMYFDSKFKFRYYTAASYANGDLVTDGRYRDCNGWYHWVCVADTTNATAGDRLRMYINGERITSFSSELYPSLNYNYAQVANNTVNVGWYNQLVGSTYFLNGSLAHYHYCDGYAYQASDFGETDSTSGVWKPKTAPSVSYGTNGFFLKFANSASLGTDSSGNGNNLTVNGSGTQTLDTPSNVYATLNALKKLTGTLSNGNLTWLANGDNGVWSTIGANKGKWYWETQVNADPVMMGIASENVQQTTDRSTNTGVYGMQNGTTYGFYRNNGTSGQSTGFPQVAAGSSVINHALDLDNGKYFMGVDGVYKDLSGTASDAAAGTNPTFSSIDTNLFWFPFVECRGTSASCDVNFGNGYFGTTVISSPNNDGAGEGKFAYAPPTGYYALNTKNLKTYG